MAGLLSFPFKTKRATFAETFRKNKPKACGFLIHPRTPSQNIETGEKRKVLEVAVVFTTPKPKQPAQV